MEQSASNDDVIACPLCGTRDGIMIRWIPEIDYRVHERTEFGCATCQKWFSAGEDRWAIADWNNFAVEEWRRKGVEQPHAELHRLLLMHYRNEIAGKESGRAVDAYLMGHIAPKCPFVVGDRFEARVPPHGIWSVRAIKAVYDIHIGPFWIIEAQGVQSNGRLGDDKHEFWQRDVERLQKCSPFWRPTRWCQVVVGDECIYDGTTGTLVEVDATVKTASICIQGEVSVIHSLAKLYVPASRFEAAESKNNDMGTKPN